MASGATASARFLQVSNLFAKNVAAANTGQDQGVVKTGLVPAAVPVTTAVTGDSVLANERAVAAAARSTLDTIKTVTQASATQIIRNRNAHG